MGKKCESQKCENFCMRDSRKFLFKNNDYVSFQISFYKLDIN